MHGFQESSTDSIRLKLFKISFSCLETKQTNEPNRSKNFPNSEGVIFVFEALKRFLLICNAQIAFVFRARRKDEDNEEKLQMKTPSPSEQWKVLLLYLLSIHFLEQLASLSRNYERSKYFDVPP